MLLDLHSLKPLCWHCQPWETVSSVDAYNKFILSESAKVETLLKLVGTPTDALVDALKL